MDTYLETISTTVSWNWEENIFSWYYDITTTEALKTH